MWRWFRVYFVLTVLLLQSDLDIPNEHWSKAAQARRPPSRMKQHHSDWIPVITAATG